MNTLISSIGEMNYGTRQLDASSPSETNSSNDEVILASASPKKPAGRRVFKETRHPVYRGVRGRNKNKWVCEMRVPNNNKSRIWLGTYPTPEMAARAHDVAALALRGKSACLNFADSAWRLTLPASTDAVEIRKAAMEAAEFFAAEDYNRECQSDINNVGDGEVVMENIANKHMQQEGGMHVENVLPQTSEYEELRDLLISMADEPIMSPPPSPRDGSSYYSWHDDDVEIFDPQVSLWNF